MLKCYYHTSSRFLSAILHDFFKAAKVSCLKFFKNKTLVTYPFHIDRIARIDTERASVRGKRKQHGSGNNRDLEVHCIASHQ